MTRRGVPGGRETHKGDSFVSVPLPFSHPLVTTTEAILPEHTIAASEAVGDAMRAWKACPTCDKRPAVARLQPPRLVMAAVQPPLRTPLPPFRQPFE